jgi:hypothetical protein
MRVRPIPSTWHEDPDRSLLPRDPALRGLFVRAPSMCVLLLEKISASGVSRGEWAWRQPGIEIRLSAALTSLVRIPLLVTGVMDELVTAR